MNKNKILVAVSIVIVAISAYMAGGSIDLKVTYPAPGSEPLALPSLPVSAAPSLNREVLDKLLDASQELKVEVEKDLGVQ
jgi:hypothetical protein